MLMFLHGLDEFSARITHGHTAALSSHVGSLPHFVASRHSSLLLLGSRSCAAQYFRSPLD
jgi:hypothetical protein